MGVCFLQMPQDFSNGVLFKDEGDDAEGAPTLAFQRVGEIDPSDELCPPLSEGGPVFLGELGFVLACGVIVVSEGMKSDVSLIPESACPRRIGAEISHAVCSRLRDLGEDASDKLEDVESLSFRMCEQGVVVCVLFRLVEKRLGARCPVNALEAHGASKQIPTKPFEPWGVLWPDGGRGIDGKTAISKRAEQVDAFVTQKLLAFEQAKYFVSEQLLRGVGIDIGDRQPLAFFVPDAARGKTISMRVYVQDTSESLRHGDDTGAGVFVKNGVGHELLDGLVS